MTQENKQNEHKNDSVVIHINNKQYKTSQSKMTGKEIKELAGGPMDYLLILVVPGGQDLPINDDQSVDLKNGMHFRLVNPGNFG